jgi:plasmid stabilization system protein ParE
VPVFKLSGKALRDVAEIITFHHRNSGTFVADELENRLFAAFRRTKQTTQILRVVQESRDLRKFF